jgi:hypothetical protein
MLWCLANGDVIICMLRNISNLCVSHWACALVYYETVYFAKKKDATDAATSMSPSHT